MDDSDNCRSKQCQPSQQRDDEHDNNNNENHEQVERITPQNAATTTGSSSSSEGKSSTQQLSSSSSRAAAVMRGPSSSTHQPTPSTSTTWQRVRVGVRVRPLTAREEGAGRGQATLRTTANNNDTLQLGKRSFRFDAVFDAHTTQQNLYLHVAPDLLQSVFDGYNATILAYGQTGSGKTFTMGSEASQLSSSPLHYSEEKQDGAHATTTTTATATAASSSLDIDSQQDTASSSSLSSSSSASASLGLIPRFMADLFHTIHRMEQENAHPNAHPTTKKEDMMIASSEKKKKNIPRNHNTAGGVSPPTPLQLPKKKSMSSTCTHTHSTRMHRSFAVQASFLEVYGEDVHDLLQPSRPVLPIREDEHGRVVTPGLTLQSIQSADHAMQVLYQGTLHRTTASTWMNVTSSRSHAVFCVHVDTTTTTTTTTTATTTTGAAAAHTQTTTPHTSTTTMRSRLTFVDLAGSERLKKTGAEGERAREGIKINEGLLALGNVINALASSTSIPSQTQPQSQPHIPYRQSKLTRLLQDALGGNSRTLFLACVSPSDINASETLSTLHYASRARDIHNAPLRAAITSNHNNTDHPNANDHYNHHEHARELDRLHSIIHVLESELVSIQFGKHLQQSPDIQAYLASLYARVSSEPSAITAVSTSLMDHVTRPVPYSSSFSSSSYHTNSSSSTSAAAFASAMTGLRPAEAGSAQATTSTTTLASSSIASRSNQAIPPSEDIHNNHSISMLQESVQNLPDWTNLNPDEEMAILDQLLELQHRDHEFESSQQQELEKVQGEIRVQQDLLNKLRHSLQSYHELKTQYELVMVELQNLEHEKTTLQSQVEQATSADPTSHASRSLQRELARVEQTLARTRLESRKHRELYRKAELEAKKCSALERTIREMKTSRAQLQRQQALAAASHRQLMERKTRELIQLQKRERQKEHVVSKLHHEIAIQKRHLDQRQEYIGKLSGKLKETERHLTKLLSLRRTTHTSMGRPRQSTSKSTGTEASEVRNTASLMPATEVSVSASASQPPSQEIESLQFMVEEWVTGKTEQAQLHLRYKELVTSYGAAMREWVTSVKQLEECTKSIQPDSMDLDGESEQKTLTAEVDQHSTSDLEQTVQDLELRVEIISQELDVMLTQMGGDGSLTHASLSSPSDIPNSEASMIDHSDLEELLNEKDSRILRVVLIDSLENLVACRVRNHVLDRSNLRFESIRNGLENEIASSTDRLNAVSRVLMQYQLNHGRPSETSEESERLKRELAQLNETLLQKNDALVNCQSSIETMEATCLLLESKLAEASQHLALYKAAHEVEIRAHSEAESVLVKMQEQWKELGFSPGPHEKIRQEIECCLYDTCNRKLQEVHELKESTLREISALQKDLTTVRSLLGIPNDSKNTSIPFLRQLDQLRETRQTLEPLYKEAKIKAESILQQARCIATAIGVDHSDLPESLRRLEEVDRSPGSLSDDNLRQCERHLTSLRLKKSNILIRNSTLTEETHRLVTEMNLRADHILPLVSQSMKKHRGGKHPEWWDDSVAANVASSIALSGGVTKATPLFSKHLEAVSDSLNSIANGRRSLSDSLRDLIERAQKTLLATVKGDEDDASEAYLTFCEALFKLPALSKERIHACIAEIEILLAGVDAMTQSEIEALSVVWEAMNVSMSKRGRFLGEIEEAVKAKETSPVGPLDAVLEICLEDCEEWVLSAVRDATNSYRQLESRVLKLEQVHREVERLRSRQDAKSKIISLDSEVRILSAKLGEFEDKQCSKHRLLSKKSNSSHLLKEERFRKHMQLKYSSKLEQLAALLKDWRTREQFDFDSTLLSEEVRSLLHNPGDTDKLVGKRTEFMHLRTVKSSKRPPTASAGPIAPIKTRKRSAIGDSSISPPLPAVTRVEKTKDPAAAMPQSPATNSKLSDISLSRQVKKPKLSQRESPCILRGTSHRAATSTGATRMPTRLSKTRAGVEHQGKPLRSSTRNAMPRSLTELPPEPPADTTKSLALPPFGHVFDKLASPRESDYQNQENAFPDDDVVNE